MVGEAGTSVASPNAESKGLRAAAPRGLPTHVLVAAAIGLLAIRLVLTFTVAPIGDEAYYWLWGQEPSLSYFDHPPLNAWLLGLSSSVFGWNVFALRFPTWISAGLTFYLFHLWARRLAPDDWVRWFLVTVVIYLASPLYFLFTGIAFPDHLLVALSLWAIYAFATFLDSWERGQPRWGVLYWAAVALGLAALAKYSAVLVAVAFVLVVVLNPRRWRLLLSWQSYAAGLIAVTVVSPVLLWNIEHDFVSFTFHLRERYEDSGFAPSWAVVRGYWLLYAIYISPFIVVPLISFLFRQPAAGFSRTSHEVGRAVFLVSTGLFSAMSMWTASAPYWNILALAPLMPHLVAYAGARLRLALFLVYGIAFGVVLGTNMGVAPLAVLAGGDDWESSVVHGWEEITAAVEAAEARFEPDFLAATRYTLAAQLAFHRGRNDVTALQSRTDQFDYWFDRSARQGQKALILGDTVQRIDDETRSSFQRIEQVAEFEVVRFGRLVNTYQLFLGHEYSGPRGDE